VTGNSGNNRRRRFREGLMFAASCSPRPSATNCWPFDRRGRPIPVLHL